MALKESEISKQAAVGITRHITFTIPETLETITKPGIATSQSKFMAPYKIGLLTTYGIKKLGQQKCCLVKGILTVWHLSSSVGARLNKFYCTST
jgi:hypothetical protein